MEDKITKARELGREHGRNYASWVFDGNTTGETYRSVVNGIDEGDPAVYDRFREPSLSGEYADDYSEQDLMRDLDAENESPETQDELATEYLNAARETFWFDVEAAARYQVGDA